MPPLAYWRAFERPLTLLISVQGSGKSELAIHWARRLAAAGRASTLALRCRS